jgi:hypothetical protein
VGTFTLNAGANNGSGTVQIDPGSAPANSNLAIFFIPFSSTSSQNRITVATFMSDANAGANATFQFPLKGSFAGTFIIDLQGGGDYFLVGENGFSSGTSFAAPLVPASTIYAGFGGPTGSGNAGTGKVTVTGGCDFGSCASVQVSLNGAISNYIYQVEVCGNVQHCTPLGALPTDKQGNASASFSLKGTGIGGNSFVLTDAAGAEYISGFHVQ